MKRTTVCGRLILTGAVAVLAGAGVLLGGAPSAYAHHCDTELDDQGEFALTTGDDEHIVLHRVSDATGPDGNLVVEAVDLCADVLDSTVSAGVIDDNDSSVGYQGYVSVCTSVNGCNGTDYVGFELTNTCVWYGTLGGTCPRP